MERIIDIKLLGGIHMKPVLKLSIILAMVLTFSSCSSPEVSQKSKATTGNSGQSVQLSKVQTPVK